MDKQVTNWGGKRSQSRWRWLFKSEFNYNSPVTNLKKYTLLIKQINLKHLGISTYVFFLVAVN